MNVTRHLSFRYMVLSIVVWSLLLSPLTMRQTCFSERKPFWYLPVPVLLHHLALNTGCPKQLVLLLPSSNEGRQIWSRVTGVGWWACVGFESSLASGSSGVGLFCAAYLLIFGKTFVHSKNGNMYTATRPHAGFERRLDESRWWDFRCCREIRAFLTSDGLI